MNVASLELCRELYELSGWEPEDKYWLNGRQYGIEDKLIDSLVGITKAGKQVTYPAYYLGYLLRKLPRHLNLKRQIWHLLVMNGDKEETNWIADYVTVGRECWLHDGDKAILTEADTPENAAAKLAIELFNQGILKREAGDE